MLSGDVSAKFQIPIEHFDFGYIEKSSDVKELVKILRVLRSGDEGHYPDLERVCEKRIETLDPQNRILRRSTPVQTKHDLAPEEWQQVEGDLTQWLEEVADRPDGEYIQNDDDLPRSYRKFKHLKPPQVEDEANGETVDENLPPIRGTNVVVTSKAPEKPKEPVQNGESVEKPEKPENSEKPEKPKQQTKQAPKKKRPMPRSHREWDNIDVEEELRKIDEAEKEEKPTQPEKPKPKPAEKEPTPSPQVATEGLGLGEINKSVMSEEQVAVRAEREKEKGNEAFRAGDYEEALAYYNRSLSLQVTMAVLNNRAFSYLKLEKWDHAIKDCNTVLAEDPKNIKALYRRALAYKSRKQFAPAKKDLEKVVAMEPTHQRAIDMLETVKKAMETTKKEGNRLVIEDVSEGSEEEAENETHFGKTTLSHHDAGSAAPKTHNEPRQKHADSAEPTSRHKGPATHAKAKRDAAVNKENPVKKPIWEQEEVTEEVKSDVQCKEKDEKPKKAEESPKAPQPVVVNEVPTSQLLDEMTKLKDTAGALFKAGQYEEALTSYQRGIHSVRTKSRILTMEANAKAEINNLRYIYGLLLANAAACQIKLGQYKECLENCDESLRFVPRFAKSHLRRGTAYEALEQFEEAMADYDQVLAMEPKSKPASEGRARCEGKMAELKEKQATNLGTRIEIEQDSEDESDDDSVDSKSKDVDEPPRNEKSVIEDMPVAPIEVPQLAPDAGAFEIAQAWASLVKSGQHLIVSKSANDVGDGDVESEVQEFVPESDFFIPFWDFLRQIPPNLIAKVFANLLDGTSFSMIINCLHYSTISCERAPAENFQIASNCLVSLTSVSRFGVAVMFLNERDRQMLTDVVTCLLSNNIGQASKNNLRKHFAAYCK